jgi:hypothetical protein
MKKFIPFILIFLISYSIVFSQETNFNFGAKTNFGATFTSFNTSEGDDSHLELLLSFLANANYEGSNFNFDSEFYIQYGQIVRKDFPPQKTQDNFILTLMPSFRIMEKPSVRLFWQAKAETQLRKGYLNEQVTNFADPMFITNTLFLGEKSKLIEQTETQQFNVTYGIGYSFQNIIKKHFQLTSETTPSNNAEFADGPTAVLNFNFSKSISEKVNFNSSFNSLFLAKKDFLKSTSNSRFSSLFLASLEIYFFSIEYSNRIVYDKELGNKRQLEQSLVVGLKLNI